MELHHPIMSKLWDLGGRTKRKKRKERITPSVSIGLFSYFDFKSGCSFNLLCIPLVQILAYIMAYELLSPYFKESPLSKCLLSSSWDRLSYPLFSKLTFILLFVLLRGFFVGSSAFRSIAVLSFIILVTSWPPLP